MTDESTPEDRKMLSPEDKAMMKRNMDFFDRKYAAFGGQATMSYETLPVISLDKIDEEGAELDSDSEDFKTFIRSAYRYLETDYPKFFKMDNLSKLAFLTADILLKREGLNAEENDIALVFSNRSSSLDTDRKHQATIENKEEYFPSPAVFVYTLPNICLGEISIRHKLYSENSFFIFAKFNAGYLHQYAESLLQSGKGEKVLSGWIDFDGSDYEAFLYLVGEEGEINHTPKELNRLYNIL